uniref:Uncharacterized protein n=1 Tax=Avena sativa TaxID=4498 RepID=A0ACD5ZS64_AVESA
MPSSSSSSARQQRKLPGAESIVSVLLTQSEVESLCEKHGVPKHFTARPAGDLPVCSVPPPGSLCVHAPALEAGMRVPLHGFFCEALAHFGVAPAQLTPNGWRIMAGFLALCGSAGVPPSLSVFRHFFALTVVSSKEKGWYFFRSRDKSGLRFAGLPTPSQDWRKRFFFLSSTEPWPCPVEWGEPAKTSFLDPSLTGEEKRWVDELVRAHGAAAVDLSTDLCDSSLADAMSNTKTPPPPCATIRAASSSRGMDPSVYDMMKTMLAEKASAQPAKKVKAEPDSEAPVPPPLCGEKANGDGNPPPSAVTGVSSPARQHFPIRRHDVDTTDWEDARELLQRAVTPSQERVLATTEPSDIVASSYVAILQAANYASFSLGYALELEEKLAERDAEIAALRAQLEETNGELAEARRADWENAEVTEAMRQLLGGEESVRQRAEQALEGYRRWKDDAPGRRT